MCSCRFNEQSKKKYIKFSKDGAQKFAFKEILDCKIKTNLRVTNSSHGGFFMGHCIQTRAGYSKTYIFYDAVTFQNQLLCKF